MTLLRMHWRKLLLLLIATVAVVFGGDKLVAQLAPVATEVVNAIPCQPGEVNEKCPAVVTTTAR